MLLCRLRRAGRRRVAGRRPGITGSTGTVKVAVLLPITASGSTPAVAKALKQAAELALFDFDNPNVTLIPKDTKGTPDGARLAAESALQDGAELIIGPLFAQEVSAAAPVARQGGVPMIAFSSDEKVAGNGVYLLSFLAGRDVPRIVSFALSRGKRNFAELVPQSAYGRIAETAFAGRSPTAAARLPCARPSRRTIPTPCSARCGRSPTPSSRGRRSMRCSCRPAARSFPRLRRCWPRADSSSGRVQFIGTGQWDYPNIGSERALVGGWYPAPDPKGWSSFVAALLQDLRRGAAPHREPRL